MGISSTAYQMENLRLMRMIGLVVSMRVYGDNLGRTIVQAFVY